MRFIVVSLTALLTLAVQQQSRALAETHHVECGADAATADGSVAHPWPTLTQAASQLQTGDTLLVGPGTYAEKVVFAGSVAIRSDVLFSPPTLLLVVLLRHRSRRRRRRGRRLLSRRIN